MSPSIEHPAISVLLAVYNGQTYLREAMDSVIAQTEKDFEFIIIDDGSTDETRNILEGYAQKDLRIRLVSRPNKGLTVTLNEGLSLARGEFLARMDADDICLPERFEKQLAYLRDHPECVLLGSRVLLVDPEGMPIRKLCDEQSHEQIDIAHLNRGWPVVHPAVMMRTAAIRQIGGYRDEYNTLEDFDLFLRLAEIGKLANLPDILLHYRQHFASVTHSKAKKQIEIRQSILDETYVRRGMAKPTTSPPEKKRMRSLYDQHHYWAWTALKAGNVKTARKHALINLRHEPLSYESWRTVACTLRGR